MTATKKQTCFDRIDAAMESTLNDLRKLWEAYCDNDFDRYADDLGNMYEYGLCFDYVASDTFEDQEVGYFRYQICYGGPTEEFRIFTDPEFNAYNIQFWFLNWYDGVHRNLDGKDYLLLKEIFESFFKDSGTVEKVFNEATE